MAVKANTSKSVKSVYPMSVALTLIITAILLSFVDLMFLNDVIGKILDFGPIESIAIAFALGLIGIAIMAHHGLQTAHESVETLYSLGHYLLWLLLGIAFVLIRFFSASVLQLDSGTTDESILKIIGVSVREIDLVLAPLMFFLYIATGLMVKDGVKNLMLNPAFENWNAARKKTKLEKKKNKEEARLKVLKEKEEARLKVLKAKDEKVAGIIAEGQKKTDLNAEMLINNALNGDYENALKQYNAKLKEIKVKYQTITSNIEYIKDLDKQENQFENKVKPSLMKIVQGSVDSVQNAAALTISKKSGAPIVSLREAIRQHHNT